MVAKHISYTKVYVSINSFIWGGGKFLYCSGYWLHDVFILQKYTELVLEIVHFPHVCDISVKKTGIAQNKTKVFSEGYEHVSCWMTT